MDDVRWGLWGRLGIDEEQGGDVRILKFGKDVAGKGEDWRGSSGTWVVPSVVGAVEDIFKSA